MSMEQNFAFYIFHSPKNALFFNMVKSFKLTLKYIIISLPNCLPCFEL